MTKLHEQQSTTGLKEESSRDGGYSVARRSRSLASVTCEKAAHKAKAQHGMLLGGLALARS